MESLKIILICTLAAGAYGVAHDMVTAHLCVEYFTIGHDCPPFIPKDDPVAIALFFGFAATWWVGASAGAGLAYAARGGTRPKLAARELLWPIVLVVLATGLVSLLAGLAGYRLGSYVVEHKEPLLIEPYASLVPKAKHVSFFIDVCAHFAAYSTAAVGSLAVLVVVRRTRKRVGGDAQH